MRIGIDLQGLQSEGSSSRGIGRYSFEIVRNLIKLSPKDHFVLIANASLKNQEIQFKSQLKLNNVSYFEWSSPCPFNYISSNHNLCDLAMYLKSYACACLNLDIIIITSYLEGFTDNCLIEFDHDLINVITLSIFYDLIPFLNPDLYFKDNLEFEKFYKRKLNNLKQVDGLLAISESSAKEVSKYLNFDNSSVFNISSACNREIFNSTRNIIVSALIKPILNTPFLLYTGAGDPRKNLKGLLEAYSLLPQKLKHFKLVLAGNLLKPEKELINNWITLFGIDPENVLQTGYISDDDLVVLYRSCYLFIFPSFHEGFGLPVLEAMSCGAPVIGSNTTSVREVIKNSEAMFDPTDPISIKQLIQKVLTNIQFRKDLVVNSEIQSKRFSWSNTAKLALQACEKLIDVNKNEINKLSYQSIKQKKDINLEKLFLKISSIKFSNKNRNDQIWLMIASSIDQINIQLDFLCRGITSNESIQSWRVEGPFDSSYSLAKLNRHFVESLNEKLSNISLSITEGFGDYQPDLHYLSKFPLINSIYLNSKLKSNDTEIVSRNLYPPRVKDLNARVNLLHSYGWEESSFPFEWVNEFNTYLQGITVMSHQVKKILIDNGVNIPIQVSGLGLDHIDRVKADLDFKLNAKKFKILHISSCFPRKGVDILLHAFCDTFTDKDEVSLIIKTFPNPHNDIENIVDEIKRKNSNVPDIIIMNNDMTDEQIKSLFIQSNVLVTPSRGEGFGLPIGEAMRLGIPVITTAWGGQLDFCTNKNSWLLDYKFVFSNSHFNIEQSYWAEPSVNHLSQLLYEVYSSDEETINLKTQEAQKDTYSLTWEAVVEKNIDFVQNECIKPKPRNFKLGLLTTWHARCGIASYSKNLFSEINDDLIVFSPYEEEQTTNPSNKIIPIWHLNNEIQNFDNLYQMIISEDISTLFIQFNYGLFCFSSLSQLIDQLYEKNINIVILLHATIDPHNDEKKRLSSLRTCLLKCNRVFVHSIDDLNRLKALEITQNVSLLTHGITDLFPKVNLSKSLSRKLKFTNTKKIASYGFCLPGKGYKELIHAIGLLKETDIDVSLTIYSAIYNDQYKYFYVELKELIHQLKLDNFVSIVPEYMSDQDTLNALSVFDCIVFPYQKSNESSSASVRQGIASLRPVLVTPVDIFADASDLVAYLPGQTTQDLADGIYQWFKSDKFRLYEINYENRNQLLNKRRFSYLRKRLIDTLKSLEIN